jgi:hypothetical protein
MSDEAKQRRAANGAERRAVYPNTALLKAQQKPLGRPSTYNEATANIVLDLIAKGGQVIEICDGKPPFPSFHTWFNWLGARPDLREKYARAKHILVERYAEEIILISDGKMPLVSADEPPNPQRDRLRIDARRWVMGKLNPAFWGDKVAPPAPPDEADERTIIDVRSLDPATRKALKATLLAIEEAERNGQ